MCLIKAFVNNWSGQTAFQDIARVRMNGNEVELENLFREEDVVPGKNAERCRTSLLMELI